MIADEPTAGLDPTAAATLAREFIELARRGDSIVVIITHDLRYFIGEPTLRGTEDAGRKTVRILECELAAAGDRTPQQIAQLQLETTAEPRPTRRSLWRGLVDRISKPEETSFAEPKVRRIPARHEPRAAAQRFGNHFSTCCNGLVRSHSVPWPSSKAWPGCAVQ